MWCLQDLGTWEKHPPYHQHLYYLHRGCHWIASFMAHAITNRIQLLTKCQLVYLSRGTHRNVVLQGLPWRFLFTFIIYLNISVPCSQLLYCHLLVVPKYKPLAPLALNSIRSPPYHPVKKLCGTLEKTVVKLQLYWPCKSCLQSKKKTTVSNCGCN